MLILRRSLPASVGVLALFLFVLDESHTIPAAWWSNRNSLIAVGLGFLGLAAHLRWIVPGALIAMLPSLAAIVNARVLLAPSLGGAVIIAVIVVHAWRLKGASAATPLKRRLLRCLMWVFIAMHLAVSTVLWPVQLVALPALMNHLNGIMRSTDLDETRIAQSQVLVINAPDPYTGVYTVMLRYFDELPRAKSWWLLSMAPFTHKVTRTGEREMEVEIVEGQLCTTLIEQLFRSKDNPLRPGEQFDLKGLIITVLETGDTGPSRIGLEFAEPPESDRYQILVFRNGRYERIVPPALGDSLVLPFSLP